MTRQVHDLNDSHNKHVGLTGWACLYLHYIAEGSPLVGLAGSIEILRK